jgi:hypothetical protein
MVAVGFLLIWSGYSVGLWGWCLLRDYDLSMGQLMSPFHPYAGPWPPAKIGDDVIWPGGRSASSPASSAGPSPGGSVPGNPAAVSRGAAAGVAPVGAK